MSRYDIRSASIADRELLSALLTGAKLRHIHLDWVPALNLLGEPLFKLALQNDLPRACLATPPDPLPIAWVRLFASAHDKGLDALWNTLWSSLLEEAHEMGVELIYSLVLQEWFGPLLKASGFVQTNEVIFYEWSGSAGVLERDRRLTMRRMRQTDLSVVENIDHDAFDPAWQNSIHTLATASRLATYATVCELEDELVGYQISTASALGAHLARLAVKKAHQRQGIGRALVVDLLKHIAQRGFDRVTVNTQADNFGSQRLYSSLGFELTGQRYPMYTYSL
ncbi:MAG: GNAT family N-acetyltransferase [Anaerolineales bacterium]|jgi:ribosomal protein S18 acetylase RimI-like enzyme